MAKGDFKKHKDWPSKELDEYQKNIDAFFRFMHTRHMIWYRRFVLKKQRPWTMNKWLRDYKFTNIYRELDRGTLWYLQNILPKFVMKFDVNNGKVKMSWLKDLVFQTTIYRLLNRIETFEEVGVPKLTTFDPEDFEAKLRVIANRGEPVFTSAHLTCPCPKGVDKIGGYMLAVNDLHKKIKTITSAIRASETLKGVFSALREVHCVGAFIAYEVCCDLMYSKAIPFVENDWANVGPGAKTGVELLYPNRRFIKTYDAMVKLQQEQHEHFERLGIKFRFYTKYNPDLSLRAIEHSLCEFQKYWKLKRGLGKTRVLFRPTQKGFVVKSGGERGEEKI